MAKLLVWVWLLSVAIAPWPAHGTPDHLQAARIQRLIQRVETQAGMRFIRNGDEYSASAAAEHLRTKLRRGGARIATAEEFIDQLASRSSMSGTPYRVRLADGREMLASQWLHGQLQALEREPRR